MAFPYTILKPIYSFYNDFYHENFSVKYSGKINTEIQIKNMNNKSNKFIGGLSQAPFRQSTQGADESGV